MCPKGCWQEPAAWPRVLFVSPWARFAARSSDRSVARSMGRLAVSLLSPAAPEASACSVAGIRWALEDLVASCLHHRQWHEVQARSKLAPSLFMPPCLSAPACPGLSRPAPACPGRRLPACSTRSRCLSQAMPCVFFQLRVSTWIRKTARVCAEPAPGLLLPAPHEVGVCHRFCPVSFPDFV